MKTGTKDIRIQIDDATHAAVKVLSESADMTLDKWVATLVRNEVAKQLALARQLTATISDGSFLRDVSAKGPATKKQKLYFIRRGENGPIKIGVSTRIENRVRMLQTGCAEELRVLAVVEQTSDISERKLHRRFRRFQQSGEWFSPEPELLALIDSLRGVAA